ncbi:MAG: hypothetical protein SO179_00185 [Bacteroidales bacterium]|nr:hypothetical protein [Bacteroidales bacterium]
MKAIKIIILLSVIFSFFSCQEEEEIPINIGTIEVTEITGHSAKCLCSIPEIGAVDILSRGICWSTIQNPTIANNHTIDGSGTGYFEAFITGLSNNTTYYVRLYVTNSKGTFYGEEIKFYSIGNPTATTGSATQTGSEYSSSGFYFEGNYYNYKLIFKATSTFSNTQYAKEIGFIIDGDYFSLSKSDGEKIINMTYYTNLNNATISYQAYAKKDDGTIIYGEQKSIYLYYGGKNSMPQKIHLDLNIDETSAIKTNNIQTLDKNIKTTIRREK